MSAPVQVIVKIPVPLFRIIANQLLPTVDALGNTMEPTPPSQTAKEALSARRRDVLVV